MDTPITHTTLSQLPYTACVREHAPPLSPPSPPQSPLSPSPVSLFASHTRSSSHTPLPTPPLHHSLPFDHHSWSVTCLVLLPVRLPHPISQSRYILRHPPSLSNSYLYISVSVYLLRNLLRSPRLTFRVTSTPTCQSCGDVLTKKKLDQHRNRCHGATYTCIDCMVYFPGTTYRSHTVRQLSSAMRAPSPCAFTIIRAHCFHSV